MCNYEQLIKLLLYTVIHSEPEGFVQRIGIYLLNSLACQVEGREKKLLGKLGCVKTMLELIQYRIISNVSDEVLEVAWSTMWNMTDETPINCERFLEHEGMELFLKCVTVSLFSLTCIFFSTKKLMSFFSPAISKQRGTSSQHDGLAWERGGSGGFATKPHARQVHHSLFQVFTFVQRWNRGLVQCCWNIGSHCVRRRGSLVRYEALPNGRSSVYAKGH